jgi:dienelactone hydrolase
VGLGALVLALALVACFGHLARNVIVTLRVDPGTATCPSGPDAWSSGRIDRPGDGERTHADLGHRPAAPGRYPGLLLYSEIFQRTGPIKRVAATLAGHGLVVAVPEIYHELEPAGTELPYDAAGPAGTATGGQAGLGLRRRRPRRIGYLASHPGAPPLGTLGICIGGHPRSAPR